MIPGAPLAAHIAGSRGVKYLVNRGPCFTHVDPMHGFLLGLDPVKDSIRTLGRRPYSVNNLTILLGIRDPDSDLVASFEEILERARLDLVQGKRKDELVAFVNATSADVDDLSPERLSHGALEWLQCRARVQRLEAGWRHAL